MAAAAAKGTYFDQWPMTFVNLPIEPETNKIPTPEFVQSCKAILGLFGASIARAARGECCLLTSINRLGARPCSKYSETPTHFIQKPIDLLGSVAFSPVKSDFQGNITVCFIRQG